MSSFSLSIRYLTLAALLDWLLARTISRAVIFMPKTPLLATLFQALNTIGQFAVALAGLMAIGTVAWIAWQLWQGAQRAQAVILAMLVVSSVLFIVVPAGGLPALTNHLCVVLVLAWFGLDALVRLPLRQIAPHHRPGVSYLALAFPLATMVVGELYQLTASLSATLHLPLTALGGALFNCGEALLVSGGMVLWWAHGRGVTQRAWLIGGLPALTFAIFYFINPELSGVMAMWSVGITLYLPWPLYAAGLWLYAVTIIANARRNPDLACAFALLITSGYAPQFSTQLFFGLIALWLLTHPHLPSTIQQRERRDPADAQVAAPIHRIVRNRWGGLFTCFREPGVPHTNNGHEQFCNGLKHRQRRITGRKSVHDFIIRYGSSAAYLDPAESFAELLARFQQVPHSDFIKARHELRTIEKHLRQVHRYHHHREPFYADVEAPWTEAVCQSRKPKRK